MPRKKFAILLFALLSFGSSLLAASAGTDEDWKLTGHAEGVTIYARTRQGSSIKEFKAVGNIDAAPRAVANVLDDIEAYPHFMPYVVECRCLGRDAKGGILSYQRVSPPFCSERDYCLRAVHESKQTAAGVVYLTHWELVNGVGPVERPNVVRVRVNEGGWTLEPSGEAATRATYRIYTDSGGSLPAFLANEGNKVGIGKLFEAIRKQVKDSKYARE